LNGTNSSLSENVRFGVFEADMEAGELRKHGLRLKLSEQPFQILAMLVASRRSGVSKCCATALASDTFGISTMD